MGYLSDHVDILPCNDNHRTWSKKILQQSNYIYWLNMVLLNDIHTGSSLVLQLELEKHLEAKVQEGECWMFGHTGGSASKTARHSATWKWARQTCCLNASVVGGNYLNSGAEVIKIFAIFDDHTSKQTADMPDLSCDT